MKSHKPLAISLVAGAVEVACEDSEEVFDMVVNALVVVLL